MPAGSIIERDVYSGRFWKLLEQW